MSKSREVGGSDGETGRGGEGEKEFSVFSFRFSVFGRQAVDMGGLPGFQISDFRFAEGKSGQECMGRFGLVWSIPGGKIFRFLEISRQCQKMGSSGRRRERSGMAQRYQVPSEY
jgi:hypothetical protein